MGKKLSLSEAKIRAGKFCAFRERSPHEVLEKLNSYGLKPEEADAVLNELIDLKYIDEQRFANAYCHDKFYFQNWGKVKIRSSLFSHRIGEDVLQKALDRINEQDYFTRITSLARRKWGQLKSEEEMKRKQKTLHHLSAKGFESELIWQAINEIKSTS